ncbi:MAG TPA: VOC family protein, partial [Steroidobacteraceae bacterium]|nr:VOC family protein [Steroidobacteraceae bacterium]
PLDCSLKQAFIKGQPDIELLQPLCDTPNPWASELSEKGMQLHHLAFYVPDAEVQVQKVNAAGLIEIAEGKWKDNKPGFGEFSYVRKPGDALIIEYLSHTKS